MPTPNVRNQLRDVAPKLIELIEETVNGDVREWAEPYKRGRGLITMAALIRSVRWHLDAQNGGLRHAH